MYSNKENSGITRQLVAQNDRHDVVADLFGVHFPLRLEPYIYAMTERMAPSYHGGYWDFYTLDLDDEERGFYMAPDLQEPLDVICQNGWQGQLFADSLGITACLCAYSHLSFSQDVRFGRLMADHYHRLRAYMLDLEDAPAILGAID